MTNPESELHLNPGALSEKEDHAPGDEPSEDIGHYRPAIPVALIVLAIAQMGVHLVFFLHTTTEPDNTNNVLALTFGILVVFLIAVGSIWIMDHLSQNMMPMEQLMQMQP